jgi:hypothetical protein
VDVGEDQGPLALATLDLAREAGIHRIVYFSVFNSALFDDVPHFAGKRPSPSLTMREKASTTRKPVPIGRATSSRHAESRGL